MFGSSGLVPEPTSQVAEAGEVLGSQQRDGRIRPLRRHGAPLDPLARVHPQVSQGWHHGVLCPLAAGYVAGVLYQFTPLKQPPCPYSSVGTVYSSRSFPHAPNHWLGLVY